MQIETRPDGSRGLFYDLHPGQRRAWLSEKRIVAVIAGVRSGKTSWAVLWLHREMARRGPGDYLMAAPSYPLIDKAARPEIESFFGRLLNLGKGSDRQFTISEAGHKKLWPGIPYERPSRIIYGHADNPDSLAAMTAKAAWLDEAGQKRFRLASWEEIQRRVSFDEGRILVTSTCYDLGWMKQKLYDPWVESAHDHPLIDVINFDSTENPAFPPEEFHKAARELPMWKFEMFFRGRFSRPAGLIYDTFDPKRHVRPRRLIPADWRRFVGLDFGAVHTAAVCLAEERHPVTHVPTGKFVAYREYLPAAKIPPQTHAVRLLEGEPAYPTFVGGARSEDEWRQRFRDAGLAVMEPPVNAVEPQIDAVHELISTDRLEVMEDLTGLLDELGSYSRELDERGEPTEKIDNDSLFHYLAALRYLVTWLIRGGLGEWKPTQAQGHARDLTAQAPAGVFEADRQEQESGGGIGWGGSDEGGGLRFPEW